VLDPEMGQRAGEVAFDRFDDIFTRRFCSSFGPTTGSTAEVFLFPDPRRAPFGLCGVWSPSPAHSICLAVRTRKSFSTAVSWSF
jgi:hypothetical protein